MYVVTINNARGESLRSFVQEDMPSDEFKQALARANWHRKEDDRLSVEYSDGTSSGRLGTQPGVPAFYEKYSGLSDVLGISSATPGVLAAAGASAGMANLVVIGLVLFIALVAPFCILWVLRLRDRSPAMKRWEALANGNSDAVPLPMPTSATLWAMHKWEEQKGISRRESELVRWANRYGYYAVGLVRELNDDSVVCATYALEQRLARDAKMLSHFSKTQELLNEAVMAPHMRAVLQRVGQLDKSAVEQARQELEARRAGTAAMARSMESFSLEG